MFPLIGFTKAPVQVFKQSVPLILISIAVTASLHLSVHQNRAAPFASDFSTQTQVWQGISQWESILSVLIAENSPSASDFESQGNRASWALKIAQFFGGAVKITAATAENRAIWRREGRWGGRERRKGGKGKGRKGGQGEGKAREKREEGGERKEILISQIQLEDLLLA